MKYRISKEASLDIENICTFYLGKAHFQSL